MENQSKAAWLEQIAEKIREYTRNNPGYSPRVLKENLMKEFFISAGEAEKLAIMAGRELNLSQLGLAALELNLTFNCNLTCSYCFIHQKSPQDRMTLATAQKAIDLLMERAAFPHVNITLFGGEPLLEFNLIKKIVPYALDAAKKHNIALTWAITTNGTLINEDILKFFSQYKINMLLSIDGGPETHDRYRRTRSGEGTWHKIAGLIPLIKAYQPWLGARMTVSTEAIDTMREDFNQLVGMGINQFIIAPAQGAASWSMEEIEQYGLNQLAILRDYLKLKQKGYPIFIEEFEKGENEYTGWGCRAGRTSLAVAPNGDVSPCSKLLGLTEEAGRYIVGNVNSEINVQLLEPFQNPISRRQPYCRKCSRPCTGGCYAVNFEQTGDHFAPSEENCLFWVVCQETKRASGMLRTGCVACVGRR
ncbi:MAG: radical SAM protein [Desulfotomaculaceae bacterium]|nr:radical SAM protein [Desulfotomaculaceae bacterium]